MRHVVDIRCFDCGRKYRYRNIVSIRVRCKHENLNVVVHRDFTILPIYVTFVRGNRIIIDIDEGL